MATREVVVTSTTKPFEQTITAGGHSFIADEPTSYGGGDAGPNPYDLLLASLGACTSMTLLMYARRKGWPLERAEVRLTHERVHERDCEQPDNRDCRIERIRRNITLVGPKLTDEQRARLEQIAERCPVHKTLTGNLKIHTELT
jgi:putative redox protein